MANKTFFFFFFFFFFFYLKPKPFLFQLSWSLSLLFFPYFPPSCRRSTVSMLIIFFESRKSESDQIEFRRQPDACRYVFNTEGQNIESHTELCYRRCLGFPQSSFQFRFSDNKLTQYFTRLSDSLNLRSFSTILSETERSLPIERKEEIFSKTERNPKRVTEIVTPTLTLTPISAPENERRLSCRERTYYFGSDMKFRHDASCHMTLISSPHCYVYRYC